MEKLQAYIGYIAIVGVALILGRWYARERDRLMAQGEPWIRSWTTLPGILILVVLVILIGLKFYFG
ncbi:MAG: hypothetical protein MI742_18225 [Desulfobacterales bacterium]|nr:hypothetical protein [Desulfobacterales bacterium]